MFESPFLLAGFLSASRCFVCGYSSFLGSSGRCCKCPASAPVLSSPAVRAVTAVLESRALLTHCVRTFQHETGRLDCSLPRFGQLYREDLSLRPDHLHVKEAFLMVPETSPCSPESSQQQGWVRNMSLTQICSLFSLLPCHSPWTTRICRRYQADL